MKLWISADSDWDTYVGRILSELAPREDDFLGKDYGAGVQRVAVILMCREPELAFRRRHRFSKATRQYYTDVMLDYALMRQTDMIGRMRHVTDELHLQLSAMLGKRKLTDFNHTAFLEDLQAWLAAIVADYDGHGSGPWRY
ncbi:hypothetical protein [Stenotrophomonas sp.]|uniref:hypothetical protein n=1 Tax=Stenotrophomonas sp. TaxID=69392 RepID=UPI002FC82946